MKKSVQKAPIQKVPVQSIPIQNVAAQNVPVQNVNVQSEPVQTILKKNFKQEVFKNEKAQELFDDFDSKLNLKSKNFSMKVNKKIDQQMSKVIHKDNNFYQDMAKEPQLKQKLFQKEFQANKEEDDSFDDLNVFSEKKMKSNKPMKKKKKGMTEKNAFNQKQEEIQQEFEDNYQPPTSEQIDDAPQMKSIVQSQNNYNDIQNESDQIHTINYQPQSNTSNNNTQTVQYKQQIEQEQIPQQSQKQEQQKPQESTELITHLSKFCTIKPSTSTNYTQKDTQLFKNIKKEPITSSFSNVYSNPINENLNQSEDFKQLMKSVQDKAIQIIPFSKLENGGHLLGEGGFGSVYLGKWSNMDVAIKEMMISYQEFKTMDQEMTFMAKFRHQRLVTMYGIAVAEIRQNKLHCCIIMELMKTDLDTILFQEEHQKILNIKLRLKIIREITEGVQFLHENQVVHRDLKPKNVLIDHNAQAKLSDLGIAKVLANKEKTLNATVAFTAKYASRETAIEEETSFASDIWSLGLIYYETLTSKQVWNGLTSNKIIISLAKQDNPLPKDWENDLQSIPQIIPLIKGCLDYNPQNRPKPLEILKKLEVIEKQIH